MCWGWVLFQAKPANARNVGNEGMKLYMLFFVGDSFPSFPSQKNEFSETWVGEKFLLSTKFAEISESKKRKQYHFVAFLGGSFLAFNFIGDCLKPDYNSWSNRQKSRAFLKQLMPWKFGTPQILIYLYIIYTYVSIFVCVCVDWFWYRERKRLICVYIVCAACAYSTLGGWNSPCLITILVDFIGHIWWGLRTSLWSFVSG